MAEKALLMDIARDDLARDRTALANERTYAVWLMTGTPVVTP